MLYTKDYSLKIFGEEAKYKVQGIEHIDTEKTVSTLLRLTQFASDKTKKTVYKNYSFFVQDEHLNINVGDYISIVRIDSVDRDTVFSKGKMFHNVNLNGTVELYRENKSATQREVEAVKTELPF